MAHYPSPGHCRSMVAIVLLAFFLRTTQLDSQSLRGDEAATVLYAALPLNSLWQLSRTTDPHPPLYYAALHPWQWFFGESGWVMRYAGVAASVVAVAVLFGLATKTIRNNSIALLAATLLAINPLQIWLAQDVRAYPFFTLLGLLSSWALWRAMGGEEAKRRRGEEASKLFASSSPRLLAFFNWALYILLTVGCLYIHYYTVFLIAFQAIFVLLNAKRFWPKKWPWLTAQVMIGLMILPGLALAYNFIGEAAGGIEKIPTVDILWLASTALLTGFTLAPVWGIATSLLLLPVWLTGAIVLPRRNFTAGTFWLLFFAVPVLGVIALSIDRPFFKERFLIQAHPAFELLLAAGFITLWHLAPQKRITHYALRPTLILLVITLLAANLLALNNYFYNPAYAKSKPWRLYHNHVAKKQQPGDVMLTNFPEASVSYYSPNTLPFYVVPAERDRSLAYRLEQTEQIANAYRRIWFLPLLHQGFDETGDVLAWLDRHADRVDQTFFPTYNLNLYLSPPTIDSQMVKQEAQFAHGFRLRGFQVFDQAGNSRLLPPNGDTQEYILPLKPEDTVTLSLYWQGDGPTPAPYTVFTHLIAADGFTRAGQDNEPVWGNYPTTAWTAREKVTDKYSLTLPPGTPPGDHRLRIGWYNTATQERVPIVDQAGQPTDLVLDVIIQVAGQ